MKSMLSKALVLAVIVLFVGVSIAPSITGDIEQIREINASVIEEIAEDNLMSIQNNDENNIGTAEVKFTRVITKLMTWAMWISNCD